MSTAFVLDHVTILTGDRAGTTINDAAIVVDTQGKIEYAGPRKDMTARVGYRYYDGGNRFVTPGLINAHAHLFSDGKPLPAFMTSEKAENLVAKFMHSKPGELLLNKRTKTNVLTQMNSGVTTIRSLGDARYEAVRVRDAIERGDYLGPRVYPSGPLLAMPGGHGAPQIALCSTTPAEAAQQVRDNLAAGSTAIKIAATGGVTDAREIGQAGTPEMPEEQMRAICETAHEAGIIVAAHAQSAEGIAMALRAGVDTIEHGASMNDEIVGLFKDNPNSLRGSSALIPTLQACLPLVKLDPKVTGINEIVRANAEMIYEEMLAGIRDALEHDIMIGMGTDSALTHVTHYNTWREMDYVQRYGGLTAAHALHAATQANAQLLAIDNITGSLEADKDADLVVLDTNPLQAGFRAFTDPYLVATRGHVLQQPQVKRFDKLDEKLDTF
ncbi:amidohydrolase family protein [Glutamicibacter sp.]|uniref:metal-dependent hydrolase family protein n=1 Tax=Glutamicibacter sp. TaxID=1931995 RepID=UPI0028BD59AC|nr:amidohydrolase family protein [Glutamicibacter sp.]